MARCDDSCRGLSAWTPRKADHQETALSLDRTPRTCLGCPTPIQAFFQGLGKASRKGFARPVRPRHTQPDATQAALLPPRSPELTATGRTWPHLNERLLARRRWPDHDAILAAVRKARQRLSGEAEGMESLCSVEWAEEVG